MDIWFVTVFPEMIGSYLSESMFKKARENGLVNFHVWDLRDFTTDKHRQVDDKPFGGGAGMVLKPEPFFRANDKLLEMNSGKNFKVICPSPQGTLLNHQKSVELSGDGKLVFFCGHYKGIDERVLENLVDEEISIGDYVLTGGELPALVIADTVIRHIPGVLNTYESATSDSFADSLLEGPIYTQPREYRNLKVPDVLISGNHAKIDEWRYQQRLKRTKERRQELLKAKIGKHDVGGKNG
ncbi:MAG: tRNA (guanosine(37)-N1)-methyltransferase TrmD [Candidatus Marinimicrobia bacterium]|nr:tRNA (guanosine(37)-N1)-methyltransferase TrmD [Candidatus Neomarinimicrobiota bacterium]